MTSTPTAAALLDVREIDIPLRHDAIFAAFRTLDVGDRIEITDDQDPKALYYKFQLEAPGDFAWNCLDVGPGVWRVDVRKLGRAYGSGDCCGRCGGQACSNEERTARHAPAVPEPMVLGLARRSLAAHEA